MIFGLRTWLARGCGCESSPGVQHVRRAVSLHDNRHTDTAAYVDGARGASLIDDDLGESFHPVEARKNASCAMAQGLADDHADVTQIHGSLDGDRDVPAQGSPADDEGLRPGGGRW